MDLPLNQIIHGDCLEVMPLLPDKSIDMILCDLPYGTTACKWDSIIPFEPLWEQYERIIKDNGAIVLFGNEPFSSALRMSNIKNYKYDWKWDKVKPSGFQVAKYKPMSRIEDIMVFTKNNEKLNYYPIMVDRDKVKKSKVYSSSDSNPLKYNDGEERTYTQKYPQNLLQFSNANQKGKFHPTQKPVELCEYLIKTYTKENELVLDNCIGSGTTAIAALNTGRFFIGIEKEEKYVEIARKRIAEHTQQLSIV